ncbi:MAG: IS110 family transposase [Treponema sp.]|nr:IS110 family transposase [Treponema sp.]
MDVHKDTYSLCSFDVKKNLLFSQTQMKASTANVENYLNKVSQMNRGALTVSGYEAGPTGFKLCRELQKKGFACVIIAPTSIARTAKDKAVKTDRSDAQMLARTLAFRSYKEVVLPSENIQAVKEIVRLRSSVSKSCKRAKQNLLSFLLSHGFSYSDGVKNWTVKFFSWLKTIHFESDYLTYCFEEYLSEATRQMQHLDHLDKKLEEIENDGEIKEGVRKLKCICGINTITAVSLIAETGDFRRFKTANEFASYTGLCPGRHSSGLTDRDTGITKMGNSYLRRLLVEAAKSVKRAAPHGHKSKRILVRQAGASSEVINYADKATARIRMKMYRLEMRGVNWNKAAVAAARELACFAWGMMTDNIA